MDQHDAFEWVLWIQVGCAVIAVLATGIAIGYVIARVVAR